MVYLIPFESCGLKFLRNSSVEISVSISAGTKSSPAAVFLRRPKRIVRIISVIADQLFSFVRNVSYKLEPANPAQ